MDTKEALGGLSVALAFIGYAPYFADIFKKQTKPHAFSWLVWTLITTIFFLAQRSDNAGAGSWINGFDALISLVITVFAIVQGERDIKKKDIAALVAIPLWVFTGNPLGSVVLLSLVDVLAFYPTFRKSYSKPQEETALLYAAFATSFFLSLCALENVSLITALSSWVSLLLNVALVLMLLWRRRVLRRAVKSPSP